MTKQTKPSLPYLSDYARGKLLTELGIKNAKGLRYHRDRKAKPNILTSKHAVHSTRKRPVQCVETGEVFESIHDCARAHHIQPNHLSNHLRGLGHAVGGRHYKYAKPSQLKPKGTPRPARPVQCVETGEEFPSLAAASRKCGVTTHSIHMQLTGVYATAKGLTFRYVTPPNNQQHSTATT